MASPITLISRRPQSAWTRYGLAIVASAIMLGTRWLLEPWLGSLLPLSLLIMAVVFSAWYCGWGPAILAALLTSAGGAYWLFTSATASARIGAPLIPAILVYLLVSGFVLAFAESGRRNLAKLNQANAALHEAEVRLHEAFRSMRDSRDSLESQVQQRTLALQQLSASLLRLQDEERRRIARELHDSTGQTLTALKMNIAILRQAAESLHREWPRDLLDEVEKLADLALKEIRTTSYLLHPPLLDEAGFASAARWFVEGFSARSNIHVDLELPPELNRLPPAIELALFRVMQEGLNNVHRYSGSSRVDVRLELDKAALRLTIRDYGRGIPAAVVDSVHSGRSDIGVGLAGMRERVHELGGEFAIESDGGTCIKVVLPLPISSKGSEDRWSLGAVS